MAIDVIVNIRLFSMWHGIIKKNWGFVGGVVQQYAGFD